MKRAIPYSVAALSLLASTATGQTQTAQNQTAQVQPVQAQAQTAQSDEVQDIIVTGTRQQGRTKQESPSPIDVISQADLQRTGQQNVLDALNALLPSLSFPALGFDTAGLVRSARLRGLSPDDTLVLVNGKRRHASANINADVGPVGGSDPVDLDMIPVSLIDHVEVLRDGAAAQYGSDAIAGVINIILKTQTSGGEAYNQSGAYYKQDGFTDDAGANVGAPLGEDGYLDLAVNERLHQHSNRTGLDTRAADYGITYNPGRIVGDPAYNVLTTGYNAGYKAGEVTLYSFGTYGTRSADAFENWRTPSKAPFEYPYGFVPRETLTEADFGFTAGAKGLILGDMTWDLSTTYGEDVDHIGNVDSVNVQYYDAFGFSPTRFHNGEFNDSEWTTNLDFSKPVPLDFLYSPLNVAFGTEYRKQTYQLVAGDYFSRYSVGSQAYPGFELTDQSTPERHNEAGYLDLATNVTKEWQIDAAFRYEHYSDVGDTESGKFTTRYDITPTFALRGTISNGFRAPTLAQEYFSATNVSPTTAIVQLPVNSPAAKLIGAVPLKAERSQNYEFGATWEPIDGLHTAIDVYRVDIRDRIVDSGLLTNDLVAQAIALNGLTIEPGVVGLAQYYTNAINTKTEGADITADYVQRLPDASRINWTLALNLNTTAITHVAPTPAAFAGQGFFTPDVASEIREDSPKEKLIFQQVYLKDNFSATLRNTFWGPTVEVVADPNTGAAPYWRNEVHAAVITDVSFSYDLGDHWQFTVGANNLFDLYPSKTNPNSRFVNSTVYAPASPWGFDGGIYYGRVNYRF